MFQSPHNFFGVLKTWGSESFDFLGHEPPPPKYNPRFYFWWDLKSVEGFVFGGFAIVIPPPREAA